MEAGLSLSRQEGWQPLDSEMLKKIGVGVSIAVLASFFIYMVGFVAQGERLTEVQYLEQEIQQEESIGATYVRMDVYEVDQKATQRQLNRMEGKLDRLLEK